MASTQEAMEQDLRNQISPSTCQHQMKKVSSSELASNSVCYSCSSPISAITSQILACNRCGYVTCESCYSVDRSSSPEKFTLSLPQETNAAMPLQTSDPASFPSSKSCTLTCSCGSQVSLVCVPPAPVDSAFVLHCSNCSGTGKVEFYHQKKTMMQIVATSLYNLGLENEITSGSFETRNIVDFIQRNRQLFFPETKKPTTAEKSQNAEGMKNEPQLKKEVLAALISSLNIFEKIERVHQSTLWSLRKTPLEIADTTNNTTTTTAAAATNEIESQEDKKKGEIEDKKPKKKKRRKPESDDNFVYVNNVVDSDSDYHENEDEKERGKQQQRQKQRKDDIDDDHDHEDDDDDVTPRIKKRTGSHKFMATGPIEGEKLKGEITQILAKRMNKIVLEYHVKTNAQQDEWICASQIGPCNALTCFERKRAPHSPNTNFLPSSTPTIIDGESNLEMRNCHQCHNRNVHFIQCSKCERSFCANCLRHHQYDTEKIVNAEAYVCPVCRIICKCAACGRKNNSVAAEPSTPTSARRAPSPLKRCCTSPTTTTTTTPSFDDHYHTRSSDYEFDLATFQPPEKSQPIPCPVFHEIKEEAKPETTANSKEEDSGDDTSDEMYMRLHEVMKNKLIEEFNEAVAKSKRRKSKGTEKSKSQKGKGNEKSPKQEQTKSPKQKQKPPKTKSKSSSTQEIRPKIPKKTQQTATISNISGQEEKLSRKEPPTEVIPTTPPQATLLQMFISSPSTPLKSEASKISQTTSFVIPHQQQQQQLQQQQQPPYNSLPQQSYLQYQLQQQQKLSQISISETRRPNLTLPASATAKFTPAQQQQQPKRHTFLDEPRFVNQGYLITPVNQTQQRTLLPTPTLSTPAILQTQTQQIHQLNAGPSWLTSPSAQTIKLQQTTKTTTSPLTTSSTTSSNATSQQQQQQQQIKQLLCSRCQQVAVSPAFCPSCTLPFCGHRCFFSHFVSVHPTTPSTTITQTPVTQ